MDAPRIAIRRALLFIAVITLAGCGAQPPWKMLPSPPLSSDSRVALWVDDQDELFIGGQSDAGLGQLERSHDHGETWGIGSLPPANVFDGVVGFAPNDVWAFTGEMLVHSSDGQSFSTMPLPPLAGRLAAMWGPDGQNFWIGGDGLWRTTDGGQNYDTIFASPSADIGALWGTSVEDVYATNITDLIHSSDGLHFTAQPIAQKGREMVFIAGTGPHDVYLGWNGGVLSHSTGDGQWSQVVGTNSGDNFTAGWGDPRGDFFAVSDFAFWHTSDGGSDFDQSGPAGFTIFGGAHALYVGGLGSLHYLPR